MPATSPGLGSGGSAGPTTISPRGRRSASASSATGRVTTIFTSGREHTSGRVRGRHVELCFTRTREDGHNRAVTRRVAVDDVAAHNERMWERLAKAGIGYTRPQGAPPRDRPGKRPVLDRPAPDALRGLPLRGKRGASPAAAAGGGPCPPPR